MMIKRLLCCVAAAHLLILSTLEGDVAQDFLKGVFTEGITVDLREPKLCEGVLVTEKGGVISGPDIRIQALKIRYTQKKEEGQAIMTIEAEENLIVEFGDYYFIGQRLEYDFKSKTGVLYCGRTSLEPWFIGGERICMCADGSFIIHNAFVTTSENCQPDWKITADQTTLCDHVIQADNVKFRLFNTPLLWLPFLKLDLDSINESPLEYSIGWGGREGFRGKMIYEVFSWNRWKTFLRLDYRLSRGPGAGIETQYTSPDHKQTLQTINYMARDNSIFIPHERFRYRFQGVYTNLIHSDKTSIQLSWDKLSDKDMATDYDDQGLDLEIDGRTQLDVRHEERNWISNLMGRVRVNTFETVKQELPTFRTNWRPIELGSTGIISDNQFQASYLDFVYASHQPCVHNFNAARIELTNKLYRPFTFGGVTITPLAGFEGIYYGNIPCGGKKGLVIGLFECNANIPFHRYYGNAKHVLTPYAHYQYYTFPNVRPFSHYIFDINDGWYRLNRLRFGFQQSLYLKDNDGLIRRYLYADLYGNAFFDTETIPQVVQKSYLDIVFRPTAYLKHILATAWDFEQNQLDHFTFRTQWTASRDFAVSAEYRHRSKYAWRKADRDNFILDSFQPDHKLVHTQLSDRRDIALLHFFYRFDPRWAIEFESRHGWNQRKNKFHFNEFEVDFHANLGGASRLKVAYQHNEGEDRVALYFSVGAQRPDFACETIVPFIEF